MSQIVTVFSLKELHDLLERHPEKDRLILFVDLDLTIVQSHPENPELDVLIEPEVTKQLFDFLTDHGIYYTFVTARFYDTVCNKRKRNLRDIEENLHTTIFPLLEGMGVDIEYFKNDAVRDDFHVIKNDKNRTVGLIYKGVIFGDKKGEIIKHYRKDFGLNESHPFTIFIDDHDTYIKNVARHVPDALILKREIS